MSDVAVLPEPSRRLAGGARLMWTLGALPGAAFAIFAGFLARSVLRAVDGVPGWIPAVLPALAIAAAVVLVVVVPQLRWRRWRYEVRDEELDLRHGAWTTVRTLVPVVRIQHVETERTVLSQLFGLATVRVHTAAGSTSIPALREDEAAAIRDRIARLARVPDEL